VGAESAGAITRTKKPVSQTLRIVAFIDGSVWRK
jgi:hypothetical protein